MTPTSKIAAILATYDGATWMGEQFGTVLKQKDKAVNLWVSINSSINNIKNIYFEYSNQAIKNIILSICGEYGV